MEKTAEKKLNNLRLPQVLEICGNQFSLRVVCFNLMVSGVKRMVCNKHEHDFYEMHYITKGSLEICVDGGFLVPIDFPVADRYNLLMDISVTFATTL